MSNHPLKYYPMAYQHNQHVLNWFFITDASEAARNTLKCVLEARKNESLTIFCDDIKEDIGEAFGKGAQPVACL